MTKGRGRGVELPGLKMARAREGLSMEELKERTGIAVSTISELESGRRGAQGRTIRKLADALRVTPAELVD